jgi:hypothetical protein
VLRICYGQVVDLRDRPMSELMGWSLHFGTLLGLATSLLFSLRKPSAL